MVRNVLCAIGLLAVIAGAGCQRGPSEADKPEIRDLNIEIETGEEMDPAGGGSGGEAAPSDANADH